MTFYWWDDALALALLLAKGTRMPHRVFWTEQGWSVEPRLQLVAEVCS